MQTTNLSLSLSPVLPRPFSLPLKILPQTLHNRFLANIITKILFDDLNDGELDFLQGRSVAIVVSDLGLSYQLTLSDNRLMGADKQGENHLTIKASLYDFMSMASRQVDPDTLMFQRRLVMEGDTELGLALKNYLDGMDIEASKILSMVESFSRKTMPVYKKLFSKD
ncbi:MAG: SCP2 sterol-binding domain-containing protein [Gammaproteobacteria bacterium]|nr:SCP2 sterol-binding domain-containing protein [Gammaproteobacteria bacterium]